MCFFEGTKAETAGTDIGQTADILVNIFISSRDDNNPN